PGRDLSSVLAVIPAGAVLYLVGAALVDGAVAVQRRRSPLRGWIALHRTEFVPHVALVCIGAATAPAVVQAPWLVFVAAAPVVVLRAWTSAKLQTDRALV